MKSARITCSHCGEKIMLTQYALEQMLEAVRKQGEKSPPEKDPTVAAFEKLFGFKK